MIEYLPLATAIGGMISGFLVGLACNGDVKALNMTINGLEDGVEYWLDAWEKADTRAKSLQSEVDRQADVIARYQAKAPLRTVEGKFASKKAETTAMLREYVASKAVQ